MKCGSALQLISELNLGIIIKLIAHLRVSSIVLLFMSARKKQVHTYCRLQFISDSVHSVCDSIRVLIQMP